MSSALPKPLSTIAEPALASARAMPSPMPLVEPVRSETRPASGRAMVSSFFVTGLFIARLRGFARSGVCGAQIAAREEKSEMPFR
jgi:hypothetical protein